MFNAVINGSKTMTRRILKPQLDFSNKNGQWAYDLEKDKLTHIKPRYKVGETVYLKEPYLVREKNEQFEEKVFYKYDGIPTHIWKNKLFMPEEYARHFIEITGVRCERLRDISDEDCMKEGVEKCGIGFINLIDMNLYTSKRDCFAALIDKINGKDTWDSNPFVWVYDFVLKK